MKAIFVEFKLFFFKSGSQLRQPSNIGSPGDLFLWGQSLYFIASLLMEGLVHVNEIDLIRRYLPSYNRPRKVGRYSAFQVSFSFASNRCFPHDLVTIFNAPFIYYPIPSTATHGRHQSKHVSSCKRMLLLSCCCPEYL